MIRLRLNEHLRFEEMTGKRWSEARLEFAWKYCQMHRLQRGGCSDCLTSEKPFCEAHEPVFRACEDCRGFKPDMRVLAVTGYLSRRRTEPALTWDEYCAEADEDDAVIDIVEAGNAEGEKTPRA